MVDTRPSIMFINRVYPPQSGATGRVLRDLAQGFVREGWQVHILTTGHASLREMDGAVKVTRVSGPVKPGLFLGYPLTWAKLFWAGRKMPKADIVVSMTDPPLAIGLGHFIAHSMGAKHIHWCQDVYPDILPALGVHLPLFFMDFLTKLTNQWMVKADKIVVIGRCMARKIAAKGVEAKKMSVIPNWPDFELTDHAPRGGRSRLNNVVSHLDSAKPYADQLKAAQKFRVLYAGNIGMAHPMNAIMEAAKILNVSNPEIEFVFVGKGMRFDKIADYRSEFGLENIRLLPYQPNSRLREVMESGDIHIMTMRGDAAGYMVPSKLYSALAVGRPAIFVGPSRCEASKVLKDFGAGVQVPENDGKKLAQAILHYRNDGDAWFAAHDGAKKAGEVFVPDDAINAWINRALRLIGREDEIQNEKEHDYAEAA